MMRVRFDLSGIVTACIGVSSCPQGYKAAIASKKAGGGDEVTNKFALYVVGMGNSTILCVIRQDNGWKLLPPGHRFGYAEEKLYGYIFPTVREA